LVRLGEGSERAIHLCMKCGSMEGTRRVVFEGKKIPADYGEPLRRVNVLFVAESPSTSGRYFYKQEGKASILRQKLFDMLVEAGLLGNPDLDEFKQRNYYLVDVAKCPFSKPNGSNAAPPRQAIENCRPFLIQELAFCKPRAICTLGKSSLRALITAKRFRLKDYVGTVNPSRLREDVACFKIPVLACWYPMSMVNWKMKIGAIKKLVRFL